MSEEYIEDVTIKKNYIGMFIACLVGLLILLSFFVFSRQSLRLDEAQSLWQTSHSPVKMISIVAEDVHVPLYHLLLHFWESLFGNAVATARTLSLIFAVLSIIAFYFLGKIAYGRLTGMFAALILTISPFFNWYGNEIRMYSLLVLLTILNQYFFIQLFRGRPEKPDKLVWVNYGATAVLGLFTHYFFGLTLLTQALFFFMFRKEFPTRALGKFVAVACVSILLFAPWAYFVLHRGEVTNATPHLYKPTTIDLFNTFSQFIFGFQDDHINTILVSLWPLTVLLVFLSLRKKYHVYPQTFYLLMNAFVPIIIAFALSVTIKPVFVTRYLILSLPSLYLLISWVFSTYPPQLARICKLGLVGLMIVMLATEAMSGKIPVKENYREATAYLSGKAAPQDVIVVAAPFTIYPVLYYYRGPVRVETLPVWDRYVSGPIPEFSDTELPKDVETLKGNHQTLWLLLSYDQGYNEKIRLYFDSHFERIDNEHFSPGLNLFAYKLRYDSEYIASTTVMSSLTLRHDKQE